MKKWFLYLLALVLSIGLCTSLVSAANNQNLEWGVSVNQRFDYNLHIEYNVESGSDDSNTPYFVVVDSLPDIPDNIAFEPDLPNPNFDLFYLNGSDGSGYFVSITFWNVIPIGNWDMIIDLWLGIPIVKETDIVNTSELVGYNYTYSFENKTHVYTQLYSKSNGVLHTFEMSYRDEIDPSIYRVREIIAVAGGDIPILYIAGAVGVGVIVILAIFVKKR